VYNVSNNHQSLDGHKIKSGSQRPLFESLGNNNPSQPPLSGFKFFRQYSVGPYILDLYCPELRLSIEADGGQHAEKGQLEYDKQRTVYLVGFDIIELRFWNNEVIENTEGVHQTILGSTTTIRAKQVKQPGFGLPPLK
jgi:very-short-patch-repair endonuclease